MTDISSLNRIGTIVKERHEYASQWKARSGGKVIGCFCSYVPEEIIYAAGMLPVRMLGGHQPQDVSESHIAGMYCSFCRDVLAQGLLRNYSYLDGIVMSNSCIHLRQAFESWRSYIPISFDYFIAMPCRVAAPWAKPLLQGELQDFQAALESWTGKRISFAALARSVQLYNTNRALLHQVYELRKNNGLYLTGAEAMQLVLSSMLMDKAEHNQLLEQCLADIPKRQERIGGIRLMVLGSENDDVGLIQLIESMGGEIVIDDLCTGSRYFWNQASVDGDLIGNLAQRYLERPPCPTKDVEEHLRFQHILNLAQSYQATGAIILLQKFCHPHEFDYPALARILRDNGLPHIVLEMDITIPYGQFRTRVEAFLEMLRKDEDRI